MDFALSFAIFFMTWWLLLFAVLPFGVRTQEDEKNIVPGTPASAPHKFNWKKVFLINTIVTIIAFTIINYILVNNLIGTSMPSEDAFEKNRIEMREK
ncbi:MAG: DUF1467 family protein [Hyphomicrobium sp.]